MNKTSKRILAVGLPLALVAATATAVAYWTGSGSGTVGATAADGVAGVTLAPTSAVTGLVPGGSITVPVTASNGNATTDVSVASLTAVPGTLASDSAACDLVSGAAVTVASPAAPVVVPAGGSAAFGSITISMANTAVDQDACKGATFSVDLAAS